MRKVTEIKLSKPSEIKLFGVKDDRLILEFETDKIILDYEHNQDCCENVYADFDIALAYKKQLREYRSYQSIIIKGIAGLGIMLEFTPEYYSLARVMIPCYNEQNGYYSSNLKLIIDHNGEKKTYDISDFVEDKID